MCCEADLQVCPYVAGHDFSLYVKGSRKGLMFCTFIRLINMDWMYTKTVSRIIQRIQLMRCKPMLLTTL